MERTTAAAPRHHHIEQYALNDVVHRRSYVDADAERVDVRELIMDNASDIQQQLQDDIHTHRCIKWYATIHMGFRRTSPDGEVQQTTTHFRNDPAILADASAFQPEAIDADFTAAIEYFNRRGSQWIVERIVDFTVTTVPYRPCQGSSYIPTPLSIAGKHAVLNVQNVDDSFCFLYSVLAALHPVEGRNHAYRVSHYKPYLSELDVTDLTFPLPFTHVDKFERLNPHIAVNVVTYDDDEHQPVPLYASPHRDRPHVVNLLLLTDGDRDTTQYRQHYVLVRNLSFLVAGRTKHKTRTFVCSYCLHCFSVQRSLDAHLELCSRHVPQCVVYPKPGTRDAVMTYDDVQKEYEVPYVLYVDFETFLQPPSVDDDTGKVVSEHVPSGFCCLRVARVDDGETYVPYVYSGPDVMDAFYKHIYAEQDAITNILTVKKPMKKLTVEQRAEFDATKKCPYCKSFFDLKTHCKVRHHNHTTGQYLSAVCRACNLQLKYRKRKRRSDDDDDDYEDFFIPVIAHNMSGYDSHLIIKAYQHHKSLASRSGVAVIPSTTEKFLAFQIGQLIFIDSLQFLGASLEKLVGTMPPKAFQYTTAHSRCPELAKQKGLYPYEFMDGPSKFLLTRLPDREAFYSQLTESEISDDDYQRAQHAWTAFGCATMRDYHDAYLKTDVLLLADVFENFRSVCLKDYGLDPAHFYTTPGLAFQALLKMTGIKLDLFTNPDHHLFIEQNVRGGVSVISERYARANNAYTDAGRDESERASYILYLDANNLYGYAMSQPLPTGSFNLLSDADVRGFDVMTVPDDAAIGYFLEVDLSYPPELHDLHDQYPLAPEVKQIMAEMLSPWARSFLRPGAPYVSAKKLVPNLNDKDGYVVHYRTLKVCLRLGLRLKRIRSILQFKQSAWMKPYVDFNANKRQLATTEFERHLYELLNNSVFGKTVENLRNRANVALCDDVRRAKKLVALPTFRHVEIVNPNLITVHRVRGRIVQNRPIYTGFSILELSKAHMYRFHYDVMLARYTLNNCRLLFTDMDSLCYRIVTEDVYRDMAAIAADWLDTSNYPADHPLHSDKNANVLGKFKDRCGGSAPLEFVGLRAKMYSLLMATEGPAKTTAKGVKHLSHRMFRDTLTNRESTRAQFHRFQSRARDKLCLSAFDDKRYVLMDGRRSHAYGYRGGTELK